MDLVIRNARLADRPSGAPVDIGVGKGRIVAIEPDLAVDAPIYDAGGRLACPGLIETHIHIDKSRIIDRCAPQARAQLSPVKGVTPLKAGMTVEDVYAARAAQTLEQCIAHGTTRMRTQVEVDPGIGMRGFEAVQSLIADYKWAIDIEMCVFPQEGLTNYPGTDELLVEALEARRQGDRRRAALRHRRGRLRSSASSRSPASTTSTSTCISTSATIPIPCTSISCAS